MHSSWSRAIKRLALSGEEIHALLVIEHHIDHAGLRMPVRSDRSHRSGMDILYQQLQVILFLHDSIHPFYQNGSSLTCKKTAALFCD